MTDTPDNARRKKIEALRSLGPNWNSYGCEAFSMKSVDAALELEPHIPVEFDSIQPIAGGGVVFGKDGDEVTIEVYADTPDNAAVIVQVEGNVKDGPTITTVTPDNAAPQAGQLLSSAPSQEGRAAGPAVAAPMPELEDYPNLLMMMHGAVSGQHTEWPMMRAELRRLLEAHKRPLSPLADEVDALVTRIQERVAGAIVRGSGTKQLFKEAADLLLRSKLLAIGKGEGRAAGPAAAAPTPETRKLEENYAEIGQEFCERILKLEPDYCWNESPLEFLTDIINQRDEAKLQAGERLEYPNLRAKLIQARAVAKKCSVALNDWLHQYAAEMCDEKEVAESVKRMFDAGGTLFYIATLQAELRRLLTESTSP